MKNLLNLGKALNKAEQKQINGGCPANDCVIFGLDREECNTCQQGGGLWNGICKRCEDVSVPFLDDGNCGKLFF